MAGGTGGHLFPAMALAQELVRCGHEVHLATDKRVASYGGSFPAKQTHIIAAATPSLRNPIKFAGASLTIVRGIVSAYFMLGRIRPDCVVAFGGYPCFPPFVAASMRFIPGILHEQNAVLGRANRALARFAKVLATQFETTRGAEKFKLEKIVTGNPVRDQVIEAANIPYPEISEKTTLKLLVFGGSQGARVFSDLVPEAIAQLPLDLKQRLQVTQQCRPEDLERVTRFYAAAHINVELASFFDDLPQRMANSHLVVARSGASTVAELGVLGRPAILVPLPGSLDQDQRANAQIMHQAGGGWLMPEDTLSPQSLGKRLKELFSDPQDLKSAAASARKIGRPGAVKKLAEVAQKLANSRH
ncbi:UDP-N-acetylglucosamine--N-acetylmuramyl-(pentapeptide) pyrophosphoryl-undecaprenol N-acetylglucosamine transferase [hydrothermal vent metagenome]|uniref:UDP-N-acetylglucosamine--N-acetylmuramyl-(Pentapeptide) pyrophosphoryl-undecaprenol N-acetylglucosamine transferase n=1 Tax=hydrothermal vent metagenome TaxID=652676 RepID=A0A3B0TQ72_9ZZZZ